MKPHTKKAIKTGIYSAIGYGVVSAAFQYFNNDDFEILKLLFKILFFGVFMSFYFNYSFKKQSEKENK